MSNSGQKNDKKAFTLVEILVVIAVVGLLGSIIFAITRGANEQGRIAKGLYFSQHLHNSLGSWAAGIWSFDEGSGTTANDISGWDNNGTLVNTPTWRCATTDSSYTPSGQGCSLEFDGVDDYVNAGSGSSLNLDTVFTYEFWIKTSAQYKAIYNAASGGPTTGIFEIWVGTGGPLRVSIWGVQNVLISNSSVATGNWIHCAVVRTSDNNWYIYLNGVLDKSTSSTNKPTVWGSKYIGYGYSTGYFNGLIDEVRIYATSLTAAQIQSQYYTGLERLLAKDKITEQEYVQRLAL